MRLFTSLLFSLIFIYIIFSRDSIESSYEDTENDTQRYLPYIPGNLLPLYILTFAILGIFMWGTVKTAQLTLSMCFHLFLHISLYYIVLILTLPLFRKLVNARVCAMLWMLPNYLYLTTQSAMELSKPWKIIYVPGNLIWVLFLLWLFGFLGVLIWKSVEHLQFRYRILADSVKVTSPEILSVLEKAIEDARIKDAEFELVTSPHVTTPLSIGLFKSTTKVILPLRRYNPEELELILRHEIIHIARGDSWSKFFLVFCTAMCWFNPLMWIAMRKSAEDLELSCDETVLLNADMDTRQKYALLLLNTAGDERGYTTCLSASARSMRYRLKNIISPVKRRSGAIVAGIAFFVLSMTSGYVALAYGGRNGAEVIYHSQDYAQCSIRHFLTMSDRETHTNYIVKDEEAFHHYLASLTLSELTGNYSFSEGGRSISYSMDSPDRSLHIVLYDNVIKLITLGKGSTTSYYYIADGVNWKCLHKTLAPYSNKYPPLQ